MDAKDIWVIVGGVGAVIGSIISGIVIKRWDRHDNNRVDLAKIEVILKARDDVRAVENRAIEHRLRANEKRIEIVSKRYHTLRRLVTLCLVKVGVKVREHHLDDDDTDDDEHRE